MSPARPLLVVAFRKEFLGKVKVTPVRDTRDAPDLIPPYPTCVPGFRVEGVEVVCKIPGWILDDVVNVVHVEYLLFLRGVGRYQLRPAVDKDTSRLSTFGGVMVVRTVSPPVY